MRDKKVVFEQYRYVVDCKVQSPLKDTYRVLHRGGRFRRYIGEQLFKMLCRVSKVTEHRGYTYKKQVERVEIDYTEIAAVIIDQLDNLRELQETPRLIVMGTKELKQLEHASSPYQIKFPSDFEPRAYVYGKKSGEYNTITFNGIEVVMLPWFEGVLVIPEGQGGNNNANTRIQ